MAAPVIDQAIPLDFYRLELRERHGSQEAFCAACGGWVRISEHYKGDRLVLRQMPHNYPCSNFEAFIVEWREGTYPNA